MCAKRVESGIIAPRITRPIVQLMSRLPPVTAALLIANVLVYMLQQGGGDSILVHFALWPLGQSQLAQLDDGSVVRVAFQPWQMLSYAFLHGSFAHIGFNMFALWMF